MTTRRSIYLYPDDLERLKVLKARYGLGTSAAARAGIALLLAHLQNEDRQSALDRTVGPIRREDEMEQDWRLTTEDRVEQVNWLRDLTANIVFGSDDPSTSAEDRVNYYCEEFADELPEWFDDHDKNLLIEWVAESA